MKNCPICGMTNTPEELKCDCGFDFSKPPYEQPTKIQNVDLYYRGRMKFYTFIICIIPIRIVLNIGLTLAEGGYDAVSLAIVFIASVLLIIAEIGLVNYKRFGIHFLYSACLFDVCLLATASTVDIAQITPLVLSAIILSIVFIYFNKRKSMFGQLRCTKNEETNLIAGPIVSQEKELFQTKCNFCKYCGAKIDSAVVNCNSCGKRIRLFALPRFLETKNALIITSLIVAIIVMLVTIAYQSSIIVSLDDQLATLSKYNESWSSAFEGKVFITQAGERYHTHDCQFVKSASRLQAFDLEAVSRGGRYTACQVCH